MTGILIVIVTAALTALFLMWVRRPKWQLFGKISAKLPPNKEFTVTYLDGDDGGWHRHIWVREKDGTVKHFVDGAEESR